MHAPEANSQTLSDPAAERIRLALRHIADANEDSSTRKTLKRPRPASGFPVVPGEFFVLVGSALVFLCIFYSANSSVKPLLRTMEGLLGLSR